MDKQIDRQDTIESYERRVQELNVQIDQLDATIENIKVLEEKLERASKSVVDRILCEYSLKGKAKEPLILYDLSQPHLKGTLTLAPTAKLVNIDKGSILEHGSSDEIGRLMAMLGEEEMRRYSTWVDELKDNPDLIKEYQKKGKWYDAPSAAIGWLSDYVTSTGSAASRMSLMTLDKRIIGASAHLGGENYQQTVQIISDNIRKYLYLSSGTDPWLAKQYEASIATIESNLLRNLHALDNTSTAYIAQLFFSPDRAFPILESSDNTTRLWNAFSSKEVNESKIFHEDPIIDSYIRNLLNSLPDKDTNNLNTKDQQYYLYRLLFTLNITVPILELKQQQKSLGRGEDLQIATWTQTGIANDKMAQIFDLFFLLQKLGNDIHDKETADTKKYLYLYSIRKGILNLNPLPGWLKDQFRIFGECLSNVYRSNVIDESYSVKLADGTSKHPGVYVISFDAQRLLDLFGDVKRSAALLSFNPKYWKIMISSQEQ
ncbi:hypothetical protein KC678_00045 [Candidatus Dojkabacteria bacterium]|uniref:Uncharacterized protein n=1 Tax=Candidatus Dojkabacteria bacterium TaxID=2099670 RepID=A0A955I873_9BACT|nr:hypothetical protein [Candidatus Dojkabacteria bacterium]